MDIPSSNSFKSTGHAPILWPTLAMVFLISMTTALGQSSDTEELRKMILEMKSDYETRIASLEGRLVELEKSEAALKSELAETKKVSARADETARIAAASSPEPGYVRTSNLPSSKTPLGSKQPVDNVVYRNGFIWFSTQRGVSRWLTSLTPDSAIAQ